jgi:hypothetical protein
MTVAARSEKQLRLVKAIHACRRKVAGLEEEEGWRGFLVQHGGRRSLAEMNGQQLGAVLDALHAAGAPRLPGKGAGRRRLADDDQARMIRGLWLTLRDIDEIRDASEEALARFVLRQTGVAALQWLGPGQANKVIEALKAWLGRANAQHAADLEAGPERVVEALWCWLRLQGEITAVASSAERWGHSVTGLNGFAHYEPRHWRQLIARLRAWRRDVERRRRG